MRRVSQSRLMMVQRRMNFSLLAHLSFRETRRAISSLQTWFLALCAHSTARGICNIRPPSYRRGLHGRTSVVWEVDAILSLASAGNHRRGLRHRFSFFLGYEGVYLDAHYWLVVGHRLAQLLFGLVSWMDVSRGNGATACRWATPRTTGSGDTGTPSGSRYSRMDS